MSKNVLFYLQIIKGSALTMCLSICVQAYIGKHNYTAFTRHTLVCIADPLPTLRLVVPFKKQ